MYRDSGTLDLLFTNISNEYTPAHYGVSSHLGGRMGEYQLTAGGQYMTGVCTNAIGNSNTGHFAVVAAEVNTLSCDVQCETWCVHMNINGAVR